MDRLAAMETFVRVVETGSFSAAARGLNVGQPAVCKTIAQMEGRLGVRLLMRPRAGYQSLTDMGGSACGVPPTLGFSHDDVETGGRAATCQLQGHRSALRI